MSSLGHSSNGVSTSLAWRILNAKYYARWERYLPRSGIEFDKAMALLKSQGIVGRSQRYYGFVKQLIYYQLEGTYLTALIALLLIRLATRVDVSLAEGYLNPVASSTISTWSRTHLLNTQSSQRHIVSRSSYSPNPGPLTGLESFEEIVVSESPSDTDYLLLLFHAFGGSKIPDIILHRASSLQERWTDHGDRVKVTALNSGLDQQLVDLVLDET